MLYRLGAKQNEIKGRRDKTKLETTNQEVQSFIFRPCDKRRTVTRESETISEESPINRAPLDSARGGTH